MDSRLLSASAVTHAHINPVFHPGLGAVVNGRSTVRYMRFGRTVSVDRLELAPVICGRWVPRVPTHPAHMIISVLDRSTNTWQVVKEVELPEDKRISGEGMSQDTSIDEMEARLAQVLEDPPHVIDLGGITTDHLRVECDREHPAWPNHGECNGGQFNVPFGILDTLNAFGRSTDDAQTTLDYRPILKVDKMKVWAPDGMRVTDRPDMFFFESDNLSVGFSLKRPLMMHLGWDAWGNGNAGTNRLVVSNAMGGENCPPGGLSGPVLRTLAWDLGYTMWTGSVSVEGNRVTYSNLKSIGEVSIDAAFTVLSDRLTVEISQTCSKPVPVLEAEVWRLSWDERIDFTAAAAVPTLAVGRSGDVQMPFVWATGGSGCLSCRQMSGDESARMQIESFRPNGSVTGGFVLTEGPDEHGCSVIPAGKRSAAWELAVTSLAPNSGKEKDKLSGGAKMYWGSVFSCFRPEFAGFSNNAISINCHQSQCAPIEVATHTCKPENGPDPLELARFSVGRALMDGGGYGYWRNLYMDSSPQLVSAAGRIHQVGKDLSWLRSIKPGLLQSVNLMTETIGDDGLAVCKDLSGNTGSFRWSSNGMDVVGFGHVDAYVNAWTYRAMKNAAAMLLDLGSPALAEQCKEIARGIRAVYAPKLVNPETGWVAGWLSRDGRLHDYAFTWVNGPAIAFGLLDDASARSAIEGLELLRDQVGPGSARMGLPVNLLPIDPGDHMLPKIIEAGYPTFEKYTDGALSGNVGIYYLRALSMYGLGKKARKLADELSEGYAAGMFTGGLGRGSEFRSWDGVPTGYEGTLVGCTTQVYAIAIEQGALKPMSPEWWPEAGE